MTSEELDAIEAIIVEGDESVDDLADLIAALRKAEAALDRVRQECDEAYPLMHTAPKGTEVDVTDVIDSLRFYRAALDRVRALCAPASLPVGSYVSKALVRAAIEGSS